MMISGLSVASPNSLQTTEESNRDLFLKLSSEKSFSISDEHPNVFIFSSRADAVQINAADKSLTTINIDPLSTTAIENKSVKHVSTQEERSNTNTNSAATDHSGADEYVFDPSMFRGSTIDKSIIERLSVSGTFEPGIYNASLRVNGQYARGGQSKIRLALVNGVTQVCMTPELMKKMDIQEKYIKDAADTFATESCVSIKSIIPQANANFSSDYVLDVNLSQNFLEIRPKGYIDPSEFDEGVPVFFTNYSINQYYNESKTSGSTAKNNYLYVSLAGGINLGKWQLRQNSSFYYNTTDSNGQKKHDTNWHNANVYLQRAFPQINSKLLLGQINTSGQLMSSIPFSGVQLMSDERMLPSSQQGYAPVVQGVAQSNALVVVKQNNQIIYQTTVPSGPFQIRDLNPTSFNGDLNVTIKEADGSTREFTVPFSSIPDSVRPGRLKYSAVLGKTRTLSDSVEFADLDVQYGLNNAVTVGGALRLAPGYQSAALNTVYTSKIGALGLNTTVSNARYHNGHKETGWMLGTTYSKSIIPTSTNVMLAGYRYSTKGYRDFADFINENAYGGSFSNEDWSSSTYMQQYRLMFTLNQSFRKWGSVGLSASIQEYRDNRPRDIQYQLGYSVPLPKNITFSLNIARQKQWAGSYEGFINQGYRTVTTVGLSVPLGSSRQSLYTSATFDNDRNNSYQASLNGSFGDSQKTPYSYNVTALHDGKGKVTTTGASLQKNYALASASINATKSKNYWQAGMTLTGSVTAHQGGVTLGPYLGESFAIVEAQGAQGATVFNGQGAKINRFGYAVVPSLSPYRYNSIGLSTKGINNNNVDILSSEHKVAPYAGAAVKVKFHTSTGYPVLFSILDIKKEIPIGAPAFDEEGKEVGMMGQKNQIYFRAGKLSGIVHIKWGEQNSQMCTIHYQIGENQKNDNLIKSNGLCA